MRTLVIMVDTFRCSPTITASLMVPLGIIWFLVNPYSGVDVGQVSFIMTHSFVGIQVDEIHSTPIIYQHSMSIFVYNPSGNDQRFA